MGCKEVIYQDLTMNGEFMTRLHNAQEAPALFSIVIVSKIGFDISTLTYRNGHANTWYVTVTIFKLSATKLE